MHLQIPDELAQELTERAKATGSELEELAVSAIRRGLRADERIEWLLAPVRDAFQASGLTEDEAVELFEKEKHMMRRQRHEARL